jgi:hypothetical protein
MIRGIQVHGKSKVKKKPGWQKAQQEHEEFLKKMGVTGKKSDYRYEMPNYKSTNSNNVPTSDVIAGNGTKKETVKYTGDEIAGIVTTHKSNLMPVRKDNKKAMVDAAQMRRS